MATTEAPSTKEQVKTLLDEGVTDAQEIANRLGKTKATVYVHIRNLKAEAGEKPRGRGRPPKVQNGQAPSTPAKSRPAPPKAGKQTEAQTSTPTPESVASTNGHTPEFPEIVAGIEKELTKARKTVERLERMLEAASK